MLKNAIIYTIESGITPDLLELALNANGFYPPMSIDMGSEGFFPPRGGYDIAHHIPGITAFTFRRDTKIIPASVINTKAKEIVSGIEKSEGRRVGRKEFLKIKESILGYTIPKALVKSKYVNAFVDFTAGHLVIDSTSSGDAEALLEKLTRGFGEAKFGLWTTNHAPSACFNDWICGNPPDGITVDDRGYLIGGEGQRIRLTNQSMVDGKVVEFVANGGSACVEIGITLSDQYSFVLTEDLRIKRLSFLSTENDRDAENADDIYNAELTLSALAVRELRTAIAEAMGGEKEAA